MFGSSESAVKSLLSDVETCNRLTLANHEGLKSSAPYGPEDESLDWDAINWPLHEDNVGRLRDRIFTATKDGDWSRVRNLQKIMLRSWSNTLISVQQVTQRNVGRKTAGIDEEVALTSQPGWISRCTHIA
jgi:RNA-directed DNA polymerase